MTKIESPPLDYVRGDATGLSIPAHEQALRDGGEAFLTEAFRAFGALSSDNRITRIAGFEKCPGGSTGQKLFLNVEYAYAEADLPTDLFVKFSRDFSDPIRDRGKREMESEARFAALTRLPGFPIQVPIVCFADYHGESGTGLLITQRIAFGSGGIEPHREKCLDYEMPDSLPYYRVIVTALARLAAAHKSGRLAPDITARFPFDPAVAAARDPIRHSEAKLRELVADYAAFAARSPQLLPPSIASPAFIAKLDREVGRFVEHEARIKRFLQSDTELIALCHWNAHIDNAWFWRDAGGALHCGLMDWGHVRQLNVAFALWGCLSGAELQIWDRHLDELLDLFAAEFHSHGGPRLDVAELRLHLQLYVATMGLAWMMEAPARILYRLPEAIDASSTRDPIFRKSETARNQLHILTVFLNFWRMDDFGASVERLLRRDFR